MHSRIIGWADRMSSRALGSAELDAEAGRVIALVAQRAND
jgi:hypothetical protein